jgi:ubiquinone/menaquinone biosynthesis C-methylase UbiE
VSARNQCAGPFGAVYSAYIERPWLARLIGRAMWGADLRPLYRSIEGLAALEGTVVDVPCGSGLELRGLSPGVRVVAVDIEERMLERTRRRAAERGLEVETLRADMRSLPLQDASADAVLSYSGLHMIEDPGTAVAEALRVLRPGGRLVGSAFVAEGSRRQRALFDAGARRGHAVPPALSDLTAWLAELDGLEVEGEGFVVFSGVKPAR